MKNKRFSLFNWNHKIAENNATIVRMFWAIIGMVCILFLLTFSISAIVIKLKTEKDYEIREAETILNNTAGSIEANIGSYKELSRLVMLNDDVIKFLRAISVDAGIINDARFGVMDIMNVSDNLDSVIIVRNDYYYMNTGRSTYSFDFDLMHADDWRNTLLDLKGAAIISLNGNGAVFREDGLPMITVGRAIYDINSQKQTGILLLNFRTEMFNHIIRSQGQQDVCIMTSDGLFLSGEQSLSAEFNENLISDKIVHKKYGSIFERSMISAQKVSDTPFVIICKTSPGTGSVPKEIVFCLLLLMAAFIGSVVLTALFIVNNFTNPILKLSDAMEKTKESGWLKKVDVSMPNNEIGMLADSYNSMIEYLNNLFNRLIENQKEMQKAELRVLQEQIKPHFLYNSLECINCMAMDEGAQNVQKAIETLGNFYRNSLSKGSKAITLEREITIIRDYLYLQRLRYGDMIHDAYEIDDDVLDIYVPRLILQPLVENSIYHGIRLKGEDGLIKISAGIYDDKLRIEVYDTGIGMDEETIEKMLSTEGELDKENDSLSGFGLRGTVKRIRYYCNKEDVVTIESELGEYTKIVIELPIVRKEPL